MSCLNYFRNISPQLRWRTPFSFFKSNYYKHSRTQLRNSKLIRYKKLRKIHPNHRHKLSHIIQFDNGCGTTCGDYRSVRGTEAGEVQNRNRSHLNCFRRLHMTKLELFALSLFQTKSTRSWQTDQHLTWHHALRHHSRNIRTVSIILVFAGKTLSAIVGLFRSPLLKVSI